MSEAKLVGANMSEAQAAVVHRAADHWIAGGHGKSKAEFLRVIIGRGCSTELGEDFPADEILSGPKDAIAVAAEKVGMTRGQFVKYAALCAAGVDATVAHAKAIAVKVPKASSVPAIPSVRAS